MFYFTTFFDKNYLSRALVLYDSLKRHCVKFEFYALCLDEYCLNYFSINTEKYPEVISISLDEIEKKDFELKESKKNRSIIEYYFTLSPCLPLYVLNKYKLAHICSLDADIMFFSSPEPAFSYLENYSILITPHNFPQELKEYEKFGIYNVSFQIFKNDENGRICLESWRKQCIDWCYDKLEDGKFADQKYLDDWEKNFIGVSPITDIGCGVAPWNVYSYKIRKVKKDVYVNGTKLIYYHFQGLSFIGDHLVKHGLNYYIKGQKSKQIRDFIYKPYIRNIINYTEKSNFENKRNKIVLHSTLKTILLQKDWYYIRAGVLFESNTLLNWAGKSLIFGKKIIKNVAGN